MLLLLLLRRRALPAARLQLQHPRGRDRAYMLEDLHLRGRQVRSLPGLHNLRVVRIVLSTSLVTADVMADGLGKPAADAVCARLGLERQRGARGGGFVNSQ